MTRRVVSGNLPCEFAERVSDSVDYEDRAHWQAARNRYGTKRPTMTRAEAIAATVVLIMDMRQKPDDIQRLISILCEQAELEGYMRGLNKAQQLVDKHLFTVMPK